MSSEKIWQFTRRDRKTDLTDPLWEQYGIGFETEAKKYAKILDAEGHYIHEIYLTKLDPKSISQEQEERLELFNIHDAIFNIVNPPSYAK